MDEYIYFNKTYKNKFYKNKFNKTYKNLWSRFSAIFDQCLG
jgi:hypothetical protein